MQQSGVAVERFDFSCVVTLPDGTVAEIEQTGIQQDERQGMAFFVDVHPHTQPRRFAGVLHLSAPSLTNLKGCAGVTRSEQSQLVVDALRAWVRQHGLAPDFFMEVAVGAVNGDPCHVMITSR